MNKRTEEFSGIRSYIWPVHNHEYRKVIPMWIMIFMAAFIFNMLRISKDALLITAPGVGAEVIPFVKLWVLLPMAFLFIFIFTRLSNKFSSISVFNIMVSIFLLFFVSFTFAVYPFRDYLHPHRFADYLQTILPAGLSGFVAVVRYWTFAINYAMSELWGNIIVSVIFWGFANEITHVSAAKRFYILFGFGANLATIFAGYTSKFFSQASHYFVVSPLQDPWERTMMLTTLSIFVAGVVFLAAYRWMCIQGLTKSQDATNLNEPEKPKMSIRKNFAYLARSKYLLSITFTVIAYNLVINLVEVLWKDQVRQLYPVNNDFQAYMGSVTAYMGIIATVTALFIIGPVLRKFGWAFTALLTPVTLLVTSVAFFVFYFAKPYVGHFTLSLVGVSPIYLVVLAGTIQNCLSRSAKYTVFETTKEIAFTPLSRESRLKGKACIDGVTSRFGKASSSVIYQVLLFSFVSLSSTAPYVAAIVLLIVVSWVGITKSLGLQFTELTAKRAEPTPSPEPILAPVEVER